MCSALVGEEGSVTGIDMTDAQNEVNMTRSSLTLVSHMHQSRPVFHKAGYDSVIWGPRSQSIPDLLVHLHLKWSRVVCAGSQAVRRGFYAEFRLQQLQHEVRDRCYLLLADAVRRLSDSSLRQAQ